MNAKSRKKFKVKYKPRPWQKELHKLAKLKRFIILNFHRRAGKSYFAIAEIINTLITFDKRDSDGQPLRNPKGALLASTIGQAERTAKLYIQDMLEEIPDMKYNSTKNVCTFPHPNPEFGICTIQLWGTQDFDTIRGDYLDIAVLDEFAILHPDVYNKVVMPMLTDRQGKMIIISTPQGTNAFYKLYQVAKEKAHIWVARTMNVYDTKLIPDDELELIQETVSEDAWKQEYLCDWHAIPEGFYFAKEMQQLEENKGIGPYSYDPRYPVHTSWDLGMDDSMAICFFQKIGNSFVYIDYLEDRSKGLDHYVQKIKSKGYLYGKHFLPHDINVRELSTGRDRLSYLAEYGLTDVIVVPKTSNIAEVIHLTRQYLPLVRFDENKCQRLVDCLKSYQRKYDAKTDSYGDKPLKNNMVHGVDAFRTYAQVAGMNYLENNIFKQQEQFDMQGAGFDPHDLQFSNEQTGRKDTSARDFFFRAKGSHNKLLH